MKPISTARISRFSIFLAERRNYSSRVSQGLWNAEPWQTYPDGSGRTYKRAASRQERQAARLSLRTIEPSPFVASFDERGVYFFDELV